MAAQIAPKNETAFWDGVAYSGSFFMGAADVHRALVKLTPGDGKPKAVRFPDPGVVALHGERGSFLPLACLVELKLASGLGAPHRLKDLADVLELNRVAHVRRALEEELDPLVRAKFAELWEAAQIVDE